MLEDKTMKQFLLFLVSCIGQGGHGVQREVTLTLKHGVEAKNYDDVSSVHMIAHRIFITFGDPCCLLKRFFQVQK